MTKPRYEKTKISNSFSQISTKTHNDETYLQGLVVTPFCIVRVYTQGNDSSHAYTRAHTCLDFSFQGAYHRKTWQKRFTERGLSTLANRFVREVLED